MPRGKHMASYGPDRSQGTRSRGWWENTQPKQGAGEKSAGAPRPPEENREVSRTPVGQWGSSSFWNIPWAPGLCCQISRSGALWDWPPCLCLSSFPLRGPERTKSALAKTALEPPTDVRRAWAAEGRGGRGERPWAISHSEIRNSQSSVSSHRA